MIRTRRKASKRSGIQYEFPVLPFLTIMLGLMSVMALVTMGIATMRRAEQRQAQAVELVGIPHQFRPFHMRSTARTIDYMDIRGRWQPIEISEFMPPHSILQLRDHLLRHARENRALSFSGQQNTLILWVEPEGAQNAALVVQLVDEFDIPLRIGKLPILPGEEIRYDATLSQ